MPADWKIGSRIKNRWEIHGIKRGGMGVVYIVYDHEWKEAFAAKTFQDEVFARNPATANWFTQEALTWINLDLHQNITQARFVENIEGKPFLFLEYVSGGDLSRWIGTPRLTEDLPQVLRFAIQFCDGMIHATAKGVKAHRDIKPQNCLVTEDGTLKITDFGLAKAFDDSELQPAFAGMPGIAGLIILQSQTGMGAGTPPYMAPEQFLDAKHVDVRADIYSFGIMLYLMATGQLPFVGRTGEDFALLHMRAAAPSLIGDFQSLNVIVQTCLAKTAGKRFQDFSELRNILSTVFERETGKKATDPVGGMTLSALQWVAKGVSLRALGRKDEQLQCYEKALSMNPALALAWANKSGALLELGRAQEALNCASRALKHDPWLESAWFNKALSLSAVGRHEEAADCFDDVLIHNPRSDGAWYSKGCAFGELGNQAEAIKCYEQALRLNPLMDAAWNNMGEAWHKLDHPSRAVECYDKALTLNQRNADAWLNKGATLGELGQVQEEFYCYERALAINPADAEVWHSKGVSFEEMGKLEDALACYGKAIEFQPELGKSWFKKGLLLFNKFHDYEGALTCFHRAVARGVPQAQVSVIQCLAKLASP